MKTTNDKYTSPDPTVFFFAKNFLDMVSTGTTKKTKRTRSSSSTSPRKRSSASPSKYRRTTVATTKRRRVGGGGGAHRYEWILYLTDIYGIVHKKTKGSLTSSRSHYAVASSIVKNHMRLKKNGSDYTHFDLHLKDLTKHREHIYRINRLFDEKGRPKWGLNEVADKEIGALTAEENSILHAHSTYLRRDGGRLLLDPWSHQQYAKVNHPDELRDGDALPIETYFPVVVTQRPESTSLFAAEKMFVNETGSSR